MSLLVVAALGAEVAYVDSGVEVLLTGIGKALAAATLARRLSDGPRPDVVVNLGTAGALDSSLTGVHEIDVVTQHDFPYAALEELVGSAGPRAYVLAAGVPPLAVAHLTGRRVLGTGDAFVSDAATALELAARGIQLVDMEAFGLATTCAAFGVPLRCVKAVSDRADAGAADSWLDLVDGCARELGAWIRAAGY